MNIVSLTGWILYGIALSCSILSRWKPKVCWLGCLLAVLSAGLMLYEGAKYEQLAAGALVLALPMAFAGKERT